MPGTWKAEWMEAQVLRTVEAGGALERDGHFGLSNGRHSDTYVNMREIIKSPYDMSQLGEWMAQTLLHHAIPFDIIMGPANTGIVVAQWVTYHYNLKASHRHRVEFMYAVKAPASALGFELPNCYIDQLEGKRIVIVDDVGTGGTSARALYTLITQAKGIPVAVAYIINRGPVTPEKVHGLPVIATATLPLKDMRRTQCEQEGPCARGIPLSDRFGHDAPRLPK